MMEAMNAAVLQLSNSLPSEEDRPRVFQKESTKNEQEITGQDHAPFHTGLSALLSAVTIQLNDSHEKEMGSDVPNSSVATRIISSDAPSGEKPVAHENGGADTQKSTPTMAPEVAKKVPLPESLMNLLMDESNADILTFLPNGKFFAMRTQEFSTHLMKQHFALDTFESFLKELREAGFTRIEIDQPEIEVFHHRLFCKGDWKKCEVLIGELEKRNKESSQLNVTMQTMGSLNDHHVVDRTESFKRRLSPAHAGKTTSCQSNYQKSKVHNSSSGVESSETGVISSPPDPVRLLREASNEDYHNAARTIAAEKIIRNGQGHPSVGQHQQPVPLEQQAVADTTKTIVADAIESLLRDEDHTRKTFRNHEKALSQSSLPGVVPISKQLFASKRSSFDD